MLYNSPDTVYYQIAQRLKELYATSCCHASFYRVSNFISKEENKIPDEVVKELRRASQRWPCL
jgi:hypothetical protein